MVEVGEKIRPLTGQKPGLNYLGGKMKFHVYKKNRWKIILECWWYLTVPTSLVGDNGILKSTLPMFENFKKFVGNLGL